MLMLITCLCINQSSQRQLLGGKIYDLHGCYVQTLPLVQAVRRKIQTNGVEDEMQNCSLKIVIGCVPIPVGDDGPPLKTSPRNEVKVVLFVYYFNI